MPCPLCGDICRCSSDVSSRAPRWLPDLEVLPDAATSPVSPETAEAYTKNAPADHEPALPGPGGATASEDSSDWRLEVSQRLNRYHARRKPRPPRYPSLRLRFESQDSYRPPSAIGVESRDFSPAIPAASNHALALDQFAGNLEPALEDGEPAPSASSDAPTSQPGAAFAVCDELPQTATLDAALISAPTTAKIIEFPRSWTPPPAPLDQLAEPVMSRPRILEAPEVAPPPPALGGITIEPPKLPDWEKRPGIDIPLQTAPLARRMLSAFLDGLIIVAACALFGFIFWKLTAFRPPRLQLVGLAAGFAGVFWAAYQYLLLVHSGATPGLRLVRLELARFDGAPASRRRRRWRVLASFLSAASLGMGYAWVFLDEDSLCWHDRITHTYLAPKTRAMRTGTEPAE